MAEHVPQVSVVSIERLAEHVGQTVQLKGWLYASRSSGKLIFLQLRDGSGYAQCVVFKNDVSPELFELARHLPQETSLSITGEVREHERQKGVFGGNVVATTKTHVRSGGEGDDTADHARTVPFHQIADEADAATRVDALVKVLIDKGVLSEDDYEQAIREILRRRGE